MSWSMSWKVWGWGCKDEDVGVGEYWETDGLWICG